MWGVGPQIEDRLSIGRSPARVVPGRFPVRMRHRRRSGRDASSFRRERDAGDEAVGLGIMPPGHVFRCRRHFHFRRRAINQMGSRNRQCGRHGRGAENGASSASRVAAAGSVDGDPERVATLGNGDGDPPQWRRGMPGATNRSSSRDRRDHGLKEAISGVAHMRAGMHAHRGRPKSPMVSGKTCKSNRLRWITGDAGSVSVEPFDSR